MLLDISSKKYPIATALIDDDDWDKVRGYEWRVMKTKYTNYVQAKGGVLLHRIVMDAKKGEFVDHINGNGLDCRKSNMRLCTQSQNNANRRRHGQFKSKYFGVYWDNHRGGWRATITKDKKSRKSPRMKSELDAAKQYNEWAIEAHGEFAKLNPL